MPSIGIRNETKSRWERRAAITPELTEMLVDQGLEVLVEPSDHRVFTNDEYVAAGATLTDDLTRANVVTGVKEIPISQLRDHGAYLYFAHVIKGQPYNMPMLQHVLDAGCTLIDYERITDDAGQRLVFFGRHAGIAGMVDSLWALGQRMTAEGVDTPFADLKMAHDYSSYGEIREALAALGERIAAEGVPEALHPMVIGIAGYGNVASGAVEVLDLLPTVEITPAEVATFASDPEWDDTVIYRVTFREQDLVRPADPSADFLLQEYYDFPERYEGRFARFHPHLSMLINAIYWTDRYPRLVHKADLPAMVRCKVIGDISCDIDGAIEATVKATGPGDPVFVYDPATDQAVMGVQGNGPVICAVDILPAELPREASETFSRALAPYLFDLASADFSVPFAELALPPPLKRAVIAHRGELTPEYFELEAYLGPVEG